MANKQAFADQPLTTFLSATGPEASPYSRSGYWLAKRRDGRSGSWMIARYQSSNRSVIYLSCRTADLTEAKARLDEFVVRVAAGEVANTRRASATVYFIRSSAGPIKIGIARDVHRRLMELRNSSPVSLDLAACTGGGFAAEQAYHRQFSEHRLHGEWFAPHPDILAEIERINGSAAA